MRTGPQAQVNRLGKELQSKYGVTIPTAEEISKRVNDMNDFRMRLTEYFVKHNPAHLALVDDIVSRTFEVPAEAEEKINKFDQQLKSVYGESLILTKEEMEKLQVKLSRGLNKFFSRYAPDRIKNIDEIVKNTLAHGTYGIDLLSKMLLEKYGSILDLEEERPTPKGSGLGTHVSDGNGNNNSNAAAADSSGARHRQRTKSSIPPKAAAEIKRAFENARISYGLDQAEKEFAAEMNSLRKELHRFYEERNPQKLELIDSIIEHVAQRRSMVAARVNDLNIMLSNAYGADLTDYPIESSSAMGTSVSGVESVPARFLSTRILGKQLGNGSMDVLDEDHTLISSEKDKQKGEADDDEDEESFMFPLLKVPAAKLTTEMNVKERLILREQLENFYKENNPVKLKAGIVDEIISYVDERRSQRLDRLKALNDRLKQAYGKGLSNVNDMMLNSNIV